MQLGSNVRLTEVPFLLLGVQNAVMALHAVRQVAAVDEHDVSWPFEAADTIGDSISLTASRSHLPVLRQTPSVDFLKLLAVLHGRSDADSGNNSEKHHPVT